MKLRHCSRALLAHQPLPLPQQTSHSHAQAVLESRSVPHQHFCSLHPCPAFASCLSGAEDTQPDIFCRVGGISEDNFGQCRLAFPLLAVTWSCCLISLQSPRTKPLWKQRLRFCPDSTAAPC